jgi:hypothetical protein
MNNKKSIYYLASLALFLAVAGAIFAVNFLADWQFFRLDLTRNKRFTLRPTTMDTLASLPDVVTIKGIYSSNIPTVFTEYISEVKDMLREYELRGKGKVRLELIDPTNNDKLQAEVGKMGIQPELLSVPGMDQAVIQKIYASIVIQYLDKIEIIPNVVHVDSLEYDLTAKINRLTTSQELIVGIIGAPPRGPSGPNGPPEDEFGSLRKVLEKEFKLEDVSLEGGRPVDEAIKVLLVLNPMRLSEHDLFELDQYVMRGGQTIFLVDGVMMILQPNPQYQVMMPLYAMPLNEQVDSIGKLIQHYGVKRNYDLVQEKQQYLRYPNLMRPYPLFPLVKLEPRPGEPAHPILTGLQYLVFTWASSLELQTLPEGVTATRLAVTTPEAYAQTGSGNPMAAMGGGSQLRVNPMEDPMPPPPAALALPGLGQGERTLAVLLSGKFKSYFEGKPVPALQPGDTSGPPTPESAQRKDFSADTNIIVVGCSKFVSDQNPALNHQNLGFIIAAVEWMAGGKNLFRNSDVPPITGVDSTKKVLSILVAPLTAPLAVIVFGVVRFAVRERRKKKFLESVKP